MAVRTAPATAGSPLVFLVLLFALSLPFWAAGALVDSRGALPMDMPVSAFQFVLPLVVALVLVSREEGRRGAGALVNRTLSPRGSGRRLWWLPAWLLIPAIALLVCGLTPLTGVPLDGPHSPLTDVPVLFAVYLLTAFAEEAGWTGYLLRPLRDRWGPLGAGALLGVVWALWHVVGWAQGGRSAPWIAGQFLSTVALRILIVRIVEGSGGIMLTAVIVHALANVTESVIPGFTEHAAPALLNGAIQAVVATAVLIRRPRRPVSAGRPPAGRRPPTKDHPD
ncbi:CPBP family intramembrane glutamic endopeptidase [Actinomadura sp. WMMA1423]|uniref:CPBP family intramembrane glutamic endopeptidase n=1 Tax=Actinomadura sp. WMMA1423 TaxID=2591108 RepID=UPI001146E153|nr:CPBP family intramembrane glutamic endopeptidase [Actinomadura sp. WMMA1423]